MFNFPFRTRMIIALVVSLLYIIVCITIYFLFNMDTNVLSLLHIPSFVVGAFVFQFIDHIISKLR